MNPKTTRQFNPFSLAWRFLLDVYHLFRTRVEGSLRLQLMLTFGICLLAALLVASVSNSLFSHYNRKAYIDYSNGQENINSQARNLAQQIQDGAYLNSSPDQAPPNTDSNIPAIPQKSLPQQPQSPPLTSSNSNVGSDQEGQNAAVSGNFNQAQLMTTQATVALSQFINDEATNNNNLKILLINQDGRVILKSSNATEVEVDLYSTIENAMNDRFDQYYDFSPNQELTSFYPVNRVDFKGYVVVYGVPQPSLNYNYRTNSPIPFINGLAAFILLFFFLTRGKMRYLENLAAGLLEISKGNLAYRVEQKSKDELGSLAHNINQMAAELQTKIEEERRAERTKHELITNVSHDLRTPLTSIMGYLRLLKDGKYEGQAQLESFVDIAYGKSEKLRGLIEDLFEYTKLHNEDVKFHLEKVSLSELLEQLLEELVPLCEENDLTFASEIPSERIMANLDVTKTVRALENLLTNAIKYSYKPGQIQVKLAADEATATISIHNHGTPITPEDLAYLFDRFYRVEKSRSSSSGGSGLGLAIAKNIIETQGGQICAECQDEDISFHVTFPTT